MINLRKAADRGHFNHGWLDTYHTFSFADYYDPAHHGFHSLRVINEDFVQAGMGFGTHGHRDMEIVTYVLAGAVEHKDSMGTHGIIRPGDVQRMSAGTGIMHSEFNPSKSERLHLLQIWIFPEKKSIRPSYEQKHFPEDERRNRLRVIASPDGREGSVSINQDALIYAVNLDPRGPNPAGDAAEVTFELPKGRAAWIQVARGNLDLGHAFGKGKPASQGAASGTAEAGMDCAGEWLALSAGDGVSVTEEARLCLRGEKPAEVLIFDLA